jgi:hypothetical protein
MTVKAFAVEPKVLYGVLNYAYHSDMSVTMAPFVEPRDQTHLYRGWPSAASG